MRQARVAKIAGALILAWVLSICSSARAIEIVQKPMGAGENRNFLKLGESEVLLNWQQTREGRVSNVEKTLWALNYHAVSNLDDFDVVLEGKDKTVLFLWRAGLYIDSARRRAGGS